MGDISGLVEETEGEPVATEVEKLEAVPEAPTDFKPNEVTVSAPADTSNAEFLDLLLQRIQPITKSKTKLKMLVYSDPGAGKTTLVGQIPHNLIIDAEDGTQSILNHPEMMGEGVSRLPYKTFQGLEMTIEQFHKTPDQLAQFSTISIDSLSNLHKRGLAEITEREWLKNPVARNRYVAETEDHTENNEHIRRLVQQMCDLPQNIILTSHMRRIEKKKEGKFLTFPDFSEKLANTIGGMMDIVAYMYFAEVEGKEHRVLKFSPSSEVVAKCRWGKFPDNMIDPSWEKIQEVLNS